MSISLAWVYVVPHTIYLPAIICKSRVSHSHFGICLAKPISINFLHMGIYADPRKLLKMVRNRHIPSTKAIKNWIIGIKRAVSDLEAGWIPFNSIAWIMKKIKRRKKLDQMYWVILCPKIKKKNSSLLSNFCDDNLPKLHQRCLPQLSKHQNPNQSFQKIDHWKLLDNLFFF